MKRFCDYDAIVHYQPGEFASKYADELNARLILTEREILEAWQMESFLDGRYETYITTSPIVVYRLYGKYQKCENILESAITVGARLGGRFVSTEFAESCIDTKMRLALNPEWKTRKCMRQS